MDAVSIHGYPPTVKSVQRPAIEQRNLDVSKRNPDASAIAGYFLTNGRKKSGYRGVLPSSNASIVFEYTLVLPILVNYAILASTQAFCPEPEIPANIAPL